MKKVIYSITNLSKKESDKLTGVGFITESDLLIARLSRKGSAYIKNFVDCIKHCFPVMNKSDEFKGAYSEFVKFDAPIKDERKRNPEVISYETIETQVHYTIWFKIIED